MPQLLDIGLLSVVDTDGSLGVGWKLNFYITATSTRKNTYPTEADANAATNANANPVVLGADARLPPIWLLDDADYKLVLTDENDVTKETIDPVSPSVTSSIAAGANVTVTLAGGVNTIAVPVIRRADDTSGNYIVGPSDAGALLNNNPAGTKDGDINTVFGAATFGAATTAYACSAFGFGTLANVTTGHSNTALGYQAGLSLTTGIMNTLVGVDAGYVSTTMNYSVVLGHHCLNVGAFTGEGAIIIGQQTARNLTSGNYITAIGRNAMANCPATGSSYSEVIGGAAAIAASVARSCVIGAEAMSIGTSVADSFLGGYRNHYGGAPTFTVSIGGAGFFRATGGGGARNVGIGYEHGNSVAGDENTFIGYRAGYLTANTAISGAVCIGAYAGLDDLASNELVISNTTGAANVLIRGNFTSGDVTIRNDLNVGGDTIKVATQRTPASAAATGVKGEICHDADYIYVCTATDTWKRVAIATW